MSPDVTIAPTAIVHPNVELGPGTVVEDFCIIGVPPQGRGPGDMATSIGPNAHIRSHTIIYAGNRIGSRFRTGHRAFLREENEVGDDVSVGSGSHIEHHVTIHDGVHIHTNVFIPEYSILKERAWVGPNSVFTNALHPLCSRVKECLKGPVIEVDARIGANTTLLPHIIVGEGSLVGAGSVVTGDVPAGAVVVGNPAQVVQMVKDISCRFDMVDNPYTRSADGMSKLPRARPIIEQEEREAVLRILGTGMFILGEENRALEKEFAHYCGTRHAVTVNSGTSALLLALMALGVGKGDEVITAPNSFMATANAIVFAGATPVFADIDPETFNLDPAKVNEAVNERTKAILPVHLFGHPADMDPLMELAEERDLVVLEDAAQAHGARYKGRMTGSLGHAAAFSFFPTKNVTVAGDGGVVTCGDDDVAETIRRLRNNGRGPDKHDAAIFGLNYRLTELPAAVGRVQLRKLDEWNATRCRLAAIYNERLADCVRIPTEAPWADTVYHLYTIRTERRDELAAHLKERGIGTSVNYPIPIHLQTAYRKEYGFTEGMFPEAEQAAKEILNLPMYPGLSEGDVERVCDATIAFFKEGGAGPS